MTERDDDAALPIAHENSDRQQFQRVTVSIILLACPPASDSKATACQLDTFGAADFVLDVTATDFGGRLASLVAAA